MEELLLLLLVVLLILLDGLSSSERYQSYTILPVCRDIVGAIIFLDNEIYDISDQRVILVSFGKIK